MIKEKFETAPIIEEEKDIELTKNVGAERMLEPEEEKAEIKNELKEMPSEKREKIGFGLNNMGFFVQERKNNFFAKVFESAAKKFDKKSTMGRWLESFSDDYQKDTQKAREKMERIEKGEKHRFGNVVSLGGNILRYGRVVTDIVGYTMGSPFRYVMMAGMFFSRGAEAAKEARLKNEEVIEKTRVHDIDQAADEAWAIYGQAQSEAVEAGKRKASKEDLEKAYRQNVPEDLLKRLEKGAEPGTASGILQKIIRKDVEMSVNGIEKKIKKIEANKELSAKERKLEREKILSKYSRHLNDLDRMVSQYGTVDALAMGARYTKAAAKGVVGAVMVETGGLLFRQLWNHLPDIISTASDSEEIPQEELSYGETFQEESWKVKMPVPQEEIAAEPSAEKLEPGARVRPLEETIAEARETETRAAEVPPEVVAETLEKAVERGLAANFTLELGQGKVPSQLERIFHMMAVDHMDKATDASGMFAEEQGAKSLNMAANLVKLAEGHNVAGIDHEDFAKAVAWDAKANSLEIKDYAQFNQMADKLESHADRLWQEGVLQKGAVAYLNDIRKGTWEKIIQAEGLAKAGEVETGVEGHDEITADKITDFDKSEMVQEAEKALKEAQQKAAELTEGDEAQQLADKMTEETKTEAMEEKLAELPTPVSEAQFNNARLNLMDTYGMTPGESKAIFEETIGNLLKNTPENLADIKDRFGPDLDLKHDGLFSYGEYKKYCEMANNFRALKPTPEEMDMTVGEFLARKLEMGAEAIEKGPVEEIDKMAEETKTEAMEEKLAELPTPVSEAQFNNARLNLMDTYGMTPGESKAIFEETIGNLLKNTPENLADIKDRFGPDLDLKHDGLFSYGEYKKYCEMANNFRALKPIPEEMDMTVGEFLARKL